MSRWKMVSENYSHAVYNTLPIHCSRTPPVINPLDAEPTCSYPLFSMQITTNRPPALFTSPPLRQFSPFSPRLDTSSPHPRCSFISSPHVLPKSETLLPLLSLLVAKLLVELLDRTKTTHILADAGADFLQRGVEVAR